jgi:arsenite-transporting ATPase
VRVVLFTGKGGVGKTTAAAATAALAAARGRKTLVLSTDSAHSLADAFGAPLGAEPTELDTGLYGQQVDAQPGFERAWRGVADYLRQVFDVAGVEPVQAEELTVLPGAEEVLALLALRDQARGGPWDLIVVDCAPTGETLRLLALPEALSFYVDRLFPMQRRVSRAVQPALLRATGLPAPQERVFDAVHRLHADLADARQVLADPQASVRLVLTPESVVIAEARRALTALCLFGYRVDGVVANKVFPEPGADPWRAGWVSAQSDRLAEVAASFAPLPMYRVPYRATEPVGLGELLAAAEEGYGGADPCPPPVGPEPLTVRRAGDAFELLIALPQVDRGDIDLARSGDELLLTVGGRRRILTLPSALRRCRVGSASLTAGRLRVLFQPDPALWMTT